jgi:holo-[acyl-carrier protein] synthase
VRGCGIDLVSVAEVAAAVDAFGDRYLDRVLHPSEEVADAAELACAFAVKEATLKAIDAVDVPAPFPQIAWRDGRVRLHGRMAESAGGRGVATLPASAAVSDGMAYGVVLALGGAPAEEVDQ